MNKGLIRNLWHHLPAPHSQKNRAQPNSVSRFCQNYFCSTLETSSGGSKAKTVNDHGWLSFTRFDLTPCIQIVQQQFCYKQAWKASLKSCVILFDNSLKTIWQSPEECLMNAWQLLDEFCRIRQQLHWRQRWQQTNGTSRTLLQATVVCKKVHKIGRYGVKWP